MNQAQVTTTTKASEIKRVWHLIDLKDETLGRASSKIAQLLMGKAKPYFVRNLDCGYYVVVINAKSVKTTGKKEDQKNYYNYSGYPGGLRIRSLKEMRNEKPEEVIVHAVKGMLPQNKLRASMLKRMFVFAGAEHKYADKLK
jgi:large subunit ribosomal protein L13